MVPLTMPITRVMRSPTSDSRSGRMIGMPPATAASKSRSTPARSAACEQLGAVLGQQLLVAGDDRLARLEGGEDELAGRLDAADELDDEVDVGVVDDRRRRRGEHARPGARSGRGLARSRTATRVTSRRSPVRASMVGALGARSARRAGAPTLPHPSTPTRTGTVVAQLVAHGAIVGVRPRLAPTTVSARQASDVVAEEVVVGLAAHDHAGLAVARRTPPPGGAPCCSWSPSSGRRRR